MHKRYFHKWFLGFSLLYFIARVIRWSYPESFLLFSGYFTDLLFVPTMCSFALIFTRIIKRNQSIQISWYWIFILTAIVSYYFEYYLPFQPGNLYVSDPWDILCYGFGAIIFILIQSREPSNQRNYRISP